MPRTSVAFEQSTGGGGTGVAAVLVSVLARYRRIWLRRRCGVSSAIATWLPRWLPRGRAVWRGPSPLSWLPASIPAWLPACSHAELPFYPRTSRASCSRESPWRGSCWRGSWPTPAMPRTSWAQRGRPRPTQRQSQRISTLETYSCPTLGHRAVFSPVPRNPSPTLRAIVLNVILTVNGPAMQKSHAAIHSFDSVMVFPCR